MKQKFSDRVGLTKPVPIQMEGMTDALKNSIWNFSREVIYMPSYEAIGRIGKRLADGFFKVPYDLVPATGEYEFWKWLRGSYQKLEWYEVYNFLEFVMEYSGELSNGRGPQKAFMDGANVILAREMAGYRFVQGVLSPISSETEVAAIEQAVTGAHKAGLDGVRTHLTTALQLLGQKPEPDFRNSIKEAISAVESAAKCIGGVQGGGLDAALKVLAEKADLHPALVKGFNALYGYSSNEGGIRHAILEEKKVGYDEAKFMLVACSAFVHFLISKAEAAGVLKQLR